VHFDFNFPRYSLMAYHHDAAVGEREYYALFDLNVLSPVLSLAKGHNANEITRDTAALMAFLMSMDCYIEPGISAQEYSTINGEEQTRINIDLFRQADNVHPAIYADIASGLRNSISNNELPCATNDKNKNFQPYIAECYWQYYAMLLKLGTIFDSSEDPLYKLESFMKWQRDEFFFGACAILFAIQSLAPKPVKDPFKQLNKRYKNDPLKGIHNVAWDLSIVHYWAGRVFLDYPKNKHWLFCSFDSNLREIAKYLIAAEAIEQGFLLEQLVKKHWSKNQVGNVISLVSMSNSVEYDQNRKSRVMATKKMVSNIIPVLETEVMNTKRF
jgi:hypothetical protein